MTHDYQPHNYQLSAELEATCPETIITREEPQYHIYGKQNYPRVAHLATHSKKARIRKKNKSRLKRFMQTELKER